MDIFEEIVRMRRAGQRGALATIVHTNGSIPSYESLACWSAKTAPSPALLAAAASKPTSGPPRVKPWSEAPRKMVFNLNHEASYDNGLICAARSKFRRTHSPGNAIAYLFGGGHVSMAVAKSASTAGFGIVVIDDREQFANRERFPMADRVITSFEEAFTQIRPNASSYLIIVTRGHKQDMRVLSWAVRTDARYIGMIGSKRKVLSTYKALEAEVSDPKN